MLDISDNYPQLDSEWTENDWSSFIAELVESGVVTYKDIASATLMQLNPPQVGTGTTNIVKHHYPKRQAWRNVKKWFYSLTGKCEDCGTRLELQTDHIIPREQAQKEADRLDNFTLRCRRHNVARRPSHKQGGKLYLTTASALMWILLVQQPDTYKKFHDLCRGYGMTMANIRFQEAWAMAIWLYKEGKYKISDECRFTSDYLGEKY